MIEKEGSVRIDLIGGTLDIHPINLILKNAVTINLATSIKAKVSVEELDIDGVEIYSSDFELQKTYSFSEFNEENFSTDHFGSLKFLCRIISEFKLNQGAKIILSSGSPPGAGLGGSSTIGLTLYKALCEFTKKDCEAINAINVVKDIEATILDSGMTGYQDYYPAMMGGILALHPRFGKVEVEQLYSPELKKYIEEHVTLIYSGKTRFSGINNWEIYKSFFDKDPHIRKGLATIAELSHSALEAIRKKNFSLLTGIVSQEGEERKKLFPDIVPEDMEKFFLDLKMDIPHLGMKICGAGGGGCFLLLHQPSDREELDSLIKEMDSSFRKIDFKIASGVL